jgi:hypothetical protein
MRTFYKISVGRGLAVIALICVSGVGAVADHAKGPSGAFFSIDNGTDLRKFGDAQTRSLLHRVHGRGEAFDGKKLVRYCAMRKNPTGIQWVVNNLETGDVISSSANSEQLYFGASTSKIFVAATLLDKQRGKFTRAQLRQLVKMIVVSSNPAWIDLQKQAGDGNGNSGRKAVYAFTQKMGYRKIKGFQGWLKTNNGSKIHGNELNTAEVSRFLYDTYQRKYPGADVLWKIMQATRTGKGKIDRFTPSNVFLGGKTGTYSGPNESRDTIKFATIKSRNHAALLLTERGHFGMSILSNRGSSGDVAVLAGGLMREYLGIGRKPVCK